MMDTEQKGTCRLGMVVKSVMYSCAAVITEKLKCIIRALQKSNAAGLEASPPATWLEAS